MSDFSLKAKLKEAQFNNLQGLDVSIKIKKSNKESYPALKLALNNYANSIIEATRTLDSDIQFILEQEKENKKKLLISEYRVKNKTETFLIKSFDYLEIIIITSRKYFSL